MTTPLEVAIGALRNLERTTEHGHRTWQIARGALGWIERHDKNGTPGYFIAPIKPTPEIINALRTGSRKDYPSDELCRVRYAALVAAVRGGK